MMNAEDRMMNKKYLLLRVNAACGFDPTRTLFECTDHTIPHVTINSSPGVVSNLANSGMRP